MGWRKIVILPSVVENIAEAAWFIESKGMVATAEKFSDSVYDFIGSLADERVIHPPCRDPERNGLGMKCKTFREKYTIVFMDTSKEIIVYEFLPSKMIRW